MSKEDWAKNTIDKIFGELYPKNVSSILDLACGLSCKSKYLKANVKVGVDIYKPYLEIAQKDYDGALILYDVTKIDDIVLSKSFDIVLLLDIVEHLFKKDALSLIITSEKIAKKAVIIETPLGYVPQNIDILGHGGHVYQTHRCGWDDDEFIKMGYKCITRDYKMQDVKRHTDINVSNDIKLIDAIKIL